MLTKEVKLVEIQQVTHVHERVAGTTDLRIELCLYQLVNSYVTPIHRLKPHIDFCDRLFSYKRADPDDISRGAIFQLFPISDHLCLGVVQYQRV